MPSPQLPSPPGGMSDGSRLRQSWYTALNDAETQFRQLLSSPSTDWKRVVHSSANANSSTKGKGKARASPSLPEVTDVVVHRNSSQSRADVYRLVLEVPAGEELVSLEPWRAVLSTPELRQEWDPAVSGAHLMEMFDYETRIIKTSFTLGWPANPRDTVTIARTIHDDTTLIDIATSLPRSPDEPAYLRPSPPYVRSSVSLLSWCIQHLKSSQCTTDTEQKPKRWKSLGGRLRITCYWQHDLRAVWNIGSPGNMAYQLSSMVLGLLKTTLKRATRIPKLASYGFGVSIEKIWFQNDREALTVEYAVIPEDEEHQEAQLDPLKTSSLEGLHVLRERRRLTRAVEYFLPASEGWDVQLLTRASSEEVEKLPWTALAFRSSSSSLSSSATPLPLDRILLRLSHAPLIDDHSVLKVTIVIEISGPSSGLRLNGVPQTIQESEDGRSSTSNIGPQQIFQDLASAMGISVAGSSSIGSASVASSSASSTSSVPIVSKERNAAAEKTILARIKRNYIYFSSLLQEPEAKWKRTTEARGVTVTQLDSIDPTLVVYNAEATFVGVNIWDLYAAVVSHGVKEYWDKQHEDAILLSDVNELTELWHLKTKAAWPVNGRDSVVLKTVYKSPTTIHVFSFSADDLAHLFPPGLIPPPASSIATNTGTTPSSSSVNASVIRTQVDLRGWAIEALSPTTTRLTLLEQSDPKGWTNKTSIPTTMINALAGIGDFAIKWGGVPIVTRFAGAKKTEVKYEHERRSWRVEYEPLIQSKSNEEAGGSTPATPVIECEIRCDMDVWSPTSLDIVVDPPPQAISCLRRHRLSPEGGGVWLTITHQDAVCIEDERLMVIVRRGPTIGSGGGNSAGGFVMVNGERIEVDYEEMDEGEIRNARMQKRVKPTRIPLDQPPVLGVIRKRREDVEGENSDSAISSTTANTSAIPKISSPLARFFTYAVDQTQQTIAAIAPTEGQNLQDDDSLQDIPTANKTPMQHALDALTWTQDFHVNPLLAGWVNVSDRVGMNVKRRIINEVSGVVPVFKGEKVIEGVHAEDLAAVVGELMLDGGNGTVGRKKWDDRYEEERVLQRYEGGGKASFVVGKTGFPFRDRGFYIATIVAREQGTIPGMTRRNTANPVTDTSSSIDPGTKSPSTASNGPAIYIVSTSFNPSTLSVPFNASTYNPYTLPIGRIHLDAWILETLDPYNTKENYAVPSARCTRLTCVDYNGAVVNPMVLNYNGGYMVRALMGLDASIRESRPPVMRTPAQGLVLKGRGSDDEEDIADEDMFRKREKGIWRIGAEGGKAGWRSIGTIRRGDSWREKRIIVESKFNVGKKSFEALVLVSYSCERKTKTNRSEEATQDPSASKAGKSNSSNPSLSSAFISNAEKTPTTSPSSAPSTISRTLSPLPDRNRRERTLSDISSTSSTTATPGTPPVAFRSRSDSRFHRGSNGYDNFLVGEWVIELNLYPEGYEVVVQTSVLQENIKIKGLIGLESVFEDEEVEKVVFPFTYGICRLPASLYQGGIGYLGPSTPPFPKGNADVVSGEERSTKHLLKISLPSGEYLKAYGQSHQETIRDPLTGEIREPKEVEFPKWVHALGLGALKGEDPSSVIVGIEVRPSNSGEKESKRGRKVVVFDDSCRAEGKEIDVVDEKEDFPMEEAYSLVERVRNEPDLVPSGLEKPIAIHKHLVDHTALEIDGSKQDGSNSGSTVARGTVDQGYTNPEVCESEAGQTAGKNSASLSSSTSTRNDASAGAQNPSLNHLNHGTGGFLGIGLGLGSFFQMPRTMGGIRIGKDGRGQEDAKSDRSGKSTPPRLDSANAVTTTQRNVKHDWWMFTIVALIAFLLGSFMRSLLEPTDFVYVASTEGGVGSTGEWREVKRVVELPAGRSWDLWIAFVRGR